MCIDLLKDFKLRRWSWSGSTSSSQWPVTNTQNRIKVKTRWALLNNLLVNCSVELVGSTDTELGTIIGNWHQPSFRLASAGTTSNSWGVSSDNSSTNDGDQSSEENEGEEGWKFNGFNKIGNLELLKINLPFMLASELIWSSVELSPPFIPNSYRLYRSLTVVLDNKTSTT